MTATTLASPTGRRALFSFWPLLAGFVLTWTVIGTLAQGPGPVFDDMTEAFAWGQEWQLGYWKHPPFYPWVAAAWFEVMPRQEWAFFLLSFATAAVGLAALREICRSLSEGLAAEMAPILVLLTPCYTFWAANFNANSILLAVWPLTILAFVRAMERPTVWTGVVLGLAAGVAGISKYYSVLLLASLLAASFLHPRGAAAWRSPAPWVAGAVAFLVALPHGLWVLDVELHPIDYAQARMSHGASTMLRTALDVTWKAIAFVAPAPLFIVYRHGWRAMIDAARWAFDRDRLWIAVVALGPLVLTLVTGFTGVAKISSPFLPPALAMLPIVLAAGAAARFSEQDHRSGLLVHLMIAGAMMVAAPLILLANIDARDSRIGRPVTKALREAARFWTSETGQPLRIVAGTERESHAGSFYLADRPSEFTDFDMRKAPWITPERLRRDGVLVVCLASDAACQAKTGELAGRKVTTTLTFASRYLWRSAPPTTYQVTVVHPEPAIGSDQ